MNVKKHHTSEHGFGLSQLLMAMVVIGIALHYAGPRLKNMTREANENVADTKEGVTELFSRRF